MINVTEIELKKLAQVSQLELDPHDIPLLTRSVASVLAYASRVAQIAENIDEQTRYACNVMREDVAVPWNGKPLVGYAPCHENNYFVVPSIL